MAEYKATVWAHDSRSWTLGLGLRVVEVPAVSLDAPLAANLLPHDQSPASNQTQSLIHTDRSATHTA